jgi:hypothetical protein
LTTLSIEGHVGGYFGGRYSLGATPWRCVW